MKTSVRFISILLTLLLKTSVGLSFVAQEKNSNVISFYTEVNSSYFESNEDLGDCNYKIGENGPVENDELVLVQKNENEVGFGKKNLPDSPLSFIDDLDWTPELKQQLINDLESTPSLIQKFIDVPYTKKIELAEAWKVLHDAGVDDVIRRNIDELNLVHTHYDEIVNFPDGYNAWKAANSVGTYTTQIRWGILDVDARPYGNKGYWGQRIAQNDPRVEAYEMKINPNNESFYVEHPNGGFVQFENLNANALQDGKMIIQPNNSFYHVYDRPPFLRQKVLDEALRQVEAANAKGLTVEWLVSDQKALNQLTQFFDENNVNITVKFLAE